MKGEIDRDFYCSGGFVANNGKVDFCTLRGGELGKETDCKRCHRCHRKFPTPEQYRGEYGAEYPDEGAVYFQLDDRPDVWHTGEYSQVESGNYYRLEWNRVKTVMHIVCACTPFGKPDKDWRPE